MSKLVGPIFVLPLLAAACGGGGGVANGDGGSGDTSVVVSVEQGGTPLGGVDVVFHDADGAPLQSAVTSAGGQVSAELAAGSMVTVLPPSGPIRTITGLEPGDRITVSVGDQDPPAFASIEASFEGPVSGAASYVVHLGCASETAVAPDPISVAFPASCRSADDTVDVFAVARDGTNAYLATTYVKGVAAPTRGEVIDVALPAWDMNPETFTLTLSNVPADAAKDPSASGGPVSSGLARTLPRDLLGDAVDFGTEADFSEAQAYEVSLDQTSVIGAQTIASTRVESAHVAVAGAHALDLASDLMPQIDVSLDAADPSRPAASYATSAPSGAVAASVRFEYADPAPVAWEILGEASGSARAPALPTDLADRWAPPSAADIAVTVSAVRSSELAGYAAVRQSGSLTGAVVLGGAGSSYGLSISTPVASAR